MAYPALIQKIFDLREENAQLCAALASLSEINIRMSSRIAELELDGARSGTSQVKMAMRMNNLENENTGFAIAHADLARECVRMSDRLVDQELGAEHPNLAPVLSTYCDPEGYDLFCGAKVAPITIVNGGQPPHRGAALTVVLDEISNP